jgi:tetratricopeptide (TPR) repeat protein
MIGARLGEALAEAGNLSEAVDNFDKAGVSLASMLKANPGIPRLEDRRGELAIDKADAQARSKNWTAAITALREAIGIFEALGKLAPENTLVNKDLARSWSKIADAYAALARWPQAETAMRSSLGALKDIEARRALSVDEQKIRRDGEAAIDTWAQK